MTPVDKVAHSGSPSPPTNSNSAIPGESGAGLMFQASRPGSLHVPQAACVPFCEISTLRRPEHERSFSALSSKEPVPPEPRTLTVRRNVLLPSALATASPKAWCIRRHPAVLDP